MAHIVALKGLSQPHDEPVGVAPGPGRQLDVLDTLAVALSPSEVDLVGVEVELREIEELGDYFSHIGLVAQGILERLLQRVEDPVWIIMRHALKLNQCIDERAHSGEVVEDDARV